MSEKISLDGSEGKDSQQSYENNTDTNYSENESTEDVSTESDGKSERSHTDYYSNSTNVSDDITIPKIEHVVTKEKDFMDYNVVIDKNNDNNDGDDGGGGGGDSGDSMLQKRLSLKRTCCTIITIILGLGLVAWGLVTVILPICDFVRIERLNMRPGLPPYEQWVIPSPEVRLSVYIFSVENPDAFLNGTDDKLRLVEIGPIVYREHLHHKDVEHHDNSTLSYTAARRVEFLEDQNEPGILDRYIYVPNFVLLATAASLNNEFIKKIGFNLLLQGSGDPLFLNMTIHDYLWHYKSDLIHRVQEYAPFLVPTNNSGVLYQIYADFNDRYNVRIGPDYGFEHFFEITTVNGDSVVPGFNMAQGECNASIVGSTEGALYKNQLTEESVLWYWRKPLCRQVPLYYEKRVQKGPFEAYKYILRENVYDRMENETADCYKGFFQILPDGLSDVSKCFYDMPFAASNPHFYGRFPNELTKKLEGFKPVRDRHQSFIIVEPVMGIPIDQSARSQSNVIIPDLYGFSDEIERFSNMALPTFWVEYHQRELTPQIENLLYFTVFVLPILQYVITVFLFTVGITCLYIGVQRCIHPIQQSLKFGKNSTKQCSSSNGSTKFGTNCKLHEAEIAWNLK